MASTDKRTMTASPNLFRMRADHERERRYAFMARESAERAHLMPDWVMTGPLSIEVHADPLDELVDALFEPGHQVAEDFEAESLRRDQALQRQHHQGRL